MAAPGDIGVYGYGITPGTLANREDLLDLITNVDPWDTPWLTQAPKVRAFHVSHEWLTDTLAATSTAGAIEGDDWSFNTATTRPVRRTNRTQIFRKDIAVSETQRAVNPAGFRDAYSYEIAKATKEIARNIESRLFVTATAAGASGTTGAARTLTPFSGWITTTATGAGQNVSALATTTSSAGVLTPDLFNQALMQCYLNGGNPEQVYVSPAVKRVISKFTATNQNRNIAAVDKKLVATLDLYDTDFGIIQVVMDRWIPQATNTVTTTAASDISGNIFFLERSKNRLAWLRPVIHTLVGKNGDAVRGSVLGECTLEVLNPLADFICSQVNNLS